MGRLVIINLGSGNLPNGCPDITVQIVLSENNSHSIQCRGSLPPAPELEQIYRHWQFLYREFYQEHSLRSRPCSPPKNLSTRTIQIESGGITYYSDVEFQDLCQRFKILLNDWLKSESFRRIDQKIRQKLDEEDEIQVIIETNNDLLRRLPWHLWDFFEDYTKAEVALSTLEYGRVEPQSFTPAGQVRILAVLGNNDGIDLQTDRSLIEALSGAAPFFLESPSRRLLNECLWEPKGWDILFFAGHSQTEEETGRIYINETESLTIEQFRNALKEAINRGLRLAIFNSCDGLGLAQQLADLQIGQVIVMRELLPDVVAQEFFRNFLAAFSSGQSLSTSVRIAREKLEFLESEYPCATWLPVICQNPAAVSPSWQTLYGAQKRDRSPRVSSTKTLPLGGNFPFLNFQNRFQIVLVASIVVTALVMGIRQLGVLQKWELLAFDQLMALRPAEEPDPRLLLVTVTEEDVQNQNPAQRRGSSLSDHSLALLLEKLHPHQPRVIGLDIYHDFPIDPQQADLAIYLQQSDHFISICKVGADNSPGIRPLPGIPSERLSFSDLPVDPDGVIRRQLLGMAPNPISFCQTDTSFSFRIAQHYLATQGIQSQRTPDGNLQIGNVIFKKLPPDTGSYHHLDALGFQVLLNYRSSDLVAEQVTLSEILNDSVDAKLPSLVKDRIILIGTTAESFKDYFPAPHRTGRWTEKISGVVIQAQMVSQILSAVLDKRPLLWWLPNWGETLWVWGWSVVGGVVILYCRTLLHIGLAASSTLLILSSVSFILLLEGGWVPLIPAAIALTATGGSIWAYTLAKTQQQ